MRFDNSQDDPALPHTLVSLTPHLTEDHEVVPGRRRLLFNGLCDDEREVHDEFIERLTTELAQLGFAVDWHRAIVGLGTQLMLSTTDGRAFTDRFDHNIKELVRTIMPVDNLVATTHTTLANLADWTDPPTR